MTQSTSEPKPQTPQHAVVKQWIQASSSWLALSSFLIVSYAPLVVRAQTTPTTDTQQGPAPVASPVPIISPTPVINGRPTAPSPAPSTLPTRPMPVPPVGTPSAASSSNSTMPTANPIAPALVDEGYLLGPGDQLRIDIFNVPEYSGAYQVLVDGSLNLPLVGTVPVQGMTLSQASAELAERYSKYLRRPIITLSITGTRPVKLAIAGEVNRPGSYLAGTGTAAGSAEVPTVTRLIQQAGGLTQVADVRRVQVRRRRPVNRGGDQVITLDLWELIREGNLRQDIVLRDGDSVFIPTVEEVNLAEARQLPLSSIRGTENLPIKVAIIGEVSRPGTYTLQADEKTPVTSVTTAIALAGGINQIADIRRIQVRRPTRTGDDKVIDVNLWELLAGGDLRQDIPLQEGDTIIVPTAAALTPDEIAKQAVASFSPAEININVVGEVAKPGTIKLPPNTPLNQAVLAAGGFNTRAQTGTVELVRLNPNGTVTRRTIGVDFAQGISEENNPPLRNNDTVIVSKSTIAGISDEFNLFFSPITAGFGLLRLFGIIR
ncbi:MAG: SLBB domain-containing protein [Cyanobacteria bacterium]|nr:SLBB domain-containing protein [Cyanobacteriota bacterium]MDW8202728.1 SLBB domain-containing protein [Cyanobacteriota bacterium SKYGB_h_bin112]